MSRFDEIAAEIVRAAREHDENIGLIDQTHPLSRAAVLERLVVSLGWALNQTVKELARRDAQPAEAGVCEQPARVVVPSHWTPFPTPPVEDNT